MGSKPSQLQPPVLIRGEVNYLSFISALTRKTLKRVYYPGMYAYFVFHGCTYVVEATGQVHIFENATQTLQQSFPATEGISKIGVILVFPKKIVCMNSDAMWRFETRRWERLLQDSFKKVKHAQSCLLEGKTYVILSKKEPNPCTWCGNCRGTSVMECSMYVLQEDSVSMRRIPINLPYRYPAPFMIPYSGGIILVGGGRFSFVSMVYRFNVKTMTLMELGNLPLRTYIACACISQKRLYALDSDNGFLSVSLETGLGRVSSMEIVAFLWVVSRKMKKLPVVLMKKIMKKYMDMQKILF